MGNSGPSISTARFYSLLTNPAEQAKPYTVIDVRNPSEVQSSNVSKVIGDKNLRKITYIPLGNLQGYNSQQEIQNMIPPGVPVLCLCRSGMRSSRAQSHLANLGYEAINVDGGMNSFSSYAHGQM